MATLLTHNWWVPYLGKPWKANPAPPQSYNCGELARRVLHDQAGIDCPAILVADAESRLACARAMQPDVYGLLPLPEGEKPRSLDVAFLGHRMAMLHCGIGVETFEGLRILHCTETRAGTILESLPVLALTGFPRVRWFRHRSLFGEDVLCG